MNDEGALTATACGENAPCPYSEASLAPKLLTSKTTHIFSPFRSNGCSVMPGGFCIASELDSDINASTNGRATVFDVPRGPTRQPLMCLGNLKVNKTPAAAESLGRLRPGILPLVLSR